MRWSDLTLRGRILSGSTVIVALMLAAGFITYWGMDRVKTAYEQAVNREHKQALPVQQIQLAAARQQAFLIKSILLGGKADGDQYKQLADEMESRLAGLAVLLKSEQNSIEELTNSAEKFKDYSSRARAAVDAGKTEEAIGILVGDLDEASRVQTKLLDQLSAKAIKQSEDSIERAKSAADSTARWVYLMLACAILAAIAVALIVVRSITDPLRQIVRLTSSVADGDLDITLQQTEDKTEIGNLIYSFKRLVEGLRGITISIRCIAQGDLGVSVEPRSSRDLLALSLCDMVESLYSIVSKVRESSEQVKNMNISMDLAGSGRQLERDSETVAVAVQDMASVLEELSTNIRAIAKNVESQASGVNQTNISIQHMAARLQLIADSTGDLTKLVDEARGVVKSGRQSVEQAAEGMREINTSITTTAQTIEELDERAAAIGHIVEVINTISDQTNLLALNAAIEAARAGSHGLGFGVVAEEVRKLSERTARSAEEIANLIGGVQKGMAMAARQMGRSTELVSEGLEQSARAVNSLGQIETVVANVARTSTDIDGIIIEQSADTDQVLNATRELMIITHEIQAASQEQAISTGEIVKSVVRVRDAAERNTKLSEHLSTAGRSMLSHLQHLEEAVKVFHLPDEQSRAKMELETSPVIV
jgi:methyl-accepting chemotaxis protein